jgi:hypothetical protein
MGRIYQQQTMAFVAAGRAYDVTSGHLVKATFCGTPLPMDANTLLQLATLISVIAAVVGLIISIRAYKRQVSALFLHKSLEMTDR